MQDQPSDLPARQPDGRSMLPTTRVVLERRATQRYRTDEGVPLEHLEAILAHAAQAPSGYNLQPWRFIVVTDPAARQRLRKAAFDQQKVAEAPVVVIALGMKDETKSRAREVFEEGARRGAGRPEEVEQGLHNAFEFLASMPMEVWVNRHVMIAVTTMMLVAESYGFDTAPMEGFDPDAVKREFGIPAEAEVVCLLAIGTAAEPLRKYPGRFELDRIVYSERYGEPWHGAHAADGGASARSGDGRTRR